MKVFEKAVVDRATHVAIVNGLSRKLYFNQPRLSVDQGLEHTLLQSKCCYTSDLSVETYKVE